MNKVRWQQIKKLFEEASEESGESQETFLRDIKQRGLELYQEIQ